MNENYIKNHQNIKGIKTHYSKLNLALRNTFRQSEDCSQELLCAAFKQIDLECDPRV